MEIMELVVAVFSVGGTVAGAFGWLFRLESRAGVLSERIESEREMRKLLEQRINGFEGRIWEKLDNIEQLLHKKADRE